MDEERAERLRPAVVLSTTEDECTVFARDQRQVVRYLSAFPAPRVERVLPGHLLALARRADGTEVAAWRWYDAVVLDQADGTLTLWEPAHGSVVATPRDAGQTYRPGTRAYVSAGLPGADWWVAGPTVERAEDADIELAEVERFFTDLGLWTDLA